MTAPAFVTSLATFGDRIALVDERGSRLTYADLASRVDRLAATLGSTRRLVLVELANTVPSVIAYLAALRGGHPVIVAKPGDVARKGSVDSVFQPSAVHVAGKDGFTILRDDDVALHEDLAALFSTSGSTGSAKLVRLSGQNIQSNAESIATYLEIDDKEIAPTSLPLNYSFGASILSSHLSRGACVVLTDRSVVEPEFASLLQRERCTSLSGVPYTWELVEQVGLLSAEWPHLKTLTQAGGKMPASRVESLSTWARERGKRLIVMYGQTECTARMAYLPWEHTREHSDCIGMAIPGGSFRLVGEDGQTIEGENVPGELVYSGPNVMMGYATTRDDLALGQGGDERRTGDLAERNRRGLYRIVGRLSRFSKILGLRISLDEIEAMVERKGYGTGVAAGNDLLLAIGLSSPSSGPSELEAAVAAECGIPPTSVVVIDGEVPRLDNGKVNYAAMLERAESIAETRANETLSLRDELAGLLGLPTISDSETFSTLGGDSLTYIQASFAIERRLGQLPANWEHLTISALEAHETGGAVAASAATPEERKGARVEVDTDVLLRAFAITFVVFNHSRPTWMPVAPGAMSALLMLAGLNLARFRSESLFRGEALSLVRSTFTRYMLPYLGLLVVYLVARQKFDLASLLLVSTFVDTRAGTFLEPFWFIEVFLHLMLVMSGLLAIRPLRAAVAAHPLLWGSLAVAALGTMHVVSNLTKVPLPPLLLWSGVFSLGWCVHFARTQREKLLLTASSLAMPWLMPRGFEVAVILPLVIWVPRTRLFFEPIKTLIGKIGAANFQIYLLHTVVVTALGMIAGMRGSWLYPVLAIPLSLAAGVGFNALPSWTTWLPGRSSAATTTPPDEFQDA